MNYLPKQLVDAMYADYQKPMTLAAVGRKYDRTGGTMRDIFKNAGLELRPWKGNLSKKRKGNGCFQPAKPLTAKQIEQLIQNATRITVPETLKLEWRKWSWQRRGWFIARLRARIKSHKDRPEGPFSAGLEPFDYASPWAQEIICRANAGKTSREAGRKINISSQGVIYRGELWYWVWKIGYSQRISIRPLVTRYLHWTIWEEHNGRRVPAACVVSFADGNPNNHAPENLVLRTRNELCRSNQATALFRKSRERTAILLKKHQQKKANENLRIVKKISR